MPCKIRQIIKEIRVTPFKMDGNHIALRLNTFYDKCLSSSQIANHSVLPPGTKSSGKHYQLIVRLESGFYHLRKIFCLFACFINRNAQRCQAMKVHQQIIHQILHLPIEMTSQNISERHTVLSSQRMIGHERI